MSNFETPDINKNIPEKQVEDDGIEINSTLSPEQLLKEAEKQKKEIDERYQKDAERQQREIDEREQSQKDALRMEVLREQLSADVQLEPRKSDQARREPPFRYTRHGDASPSDPHYLSEASKHANNF